MRLPYAPYSVPKRENCLRRDSRKRKRPAMLASADCNNETTMVERDPHIFPFFELPVELRVAILRELWPRHLKTLRLVSRAMYSLIDNITPRSWKNVLVDYTSGPRFFFRQINCRGWVLLRHCTACVEMFGLARGASIPRLFFHKAKITDFFMRRLSSAARKSRVAVQHCEFSMCSFTCEAEQVVEFVEICKTEKLAIVECMVTTEFTQFLVKNSFVMKVSSDCHL
ncbi:hypothetical protein Y032_0065g3660 [Ancylostoma ceylanicum]|uniref:F-box domain-containing protein n=2 Tax=Ancylostoma ceylanicum TaxID=53326 RepID=A0A016U017_9BILA|nr:hypothetical protein Y032_0065g3660 [Ancylostoma ceylanicum]